MHFIRGPHPTESQSYASSASLTRCSEAAGPSKALVRRLLILQLQMILLPYFIPTQPGRNLSFQDLATAMMSEEIRATRFIRDRNPAEAFIRKAVEAVLGAPGARVREALHCMAHDFSLSVPARTRATLLRCMLGDIAESELRNYKNSIRGDIEATLLVCEFVVIRAIWRGELESALIWLRDMLPYYTLLPPERKLIVRLLSACCNFQAGLEEDLQRDLCEAALARKDCLWVPEDWDTVLNGPW